MVKSEAPDFEFSSRNTPSTAARHKSTELIAFDQNHEVQHQGPCKLQINILSKFLLVKPTNEIFKDITATFDWKFIKQKNVIFVFATHESQDFALIFNDEQKCSKVFNGIFKKREKDSVDKAMFQERFLIPIFKKIPKNGPSRLKVIIKKWIYKHDETEKKEYFQLLKDNCNGDQEMNNLQNIKQDIDCKPKTKHHPVGSNVVTAVPEIDVIYLTDDNEFDGKNNVAEVAITNQNFFFLTNNTKMLDESLFKMVSFKHQNRVSRKLLIFTSDDKTQCFKYNYYSRKNIFYHRCHYVGRNVIKAILAQDENGNDCIKLEDKDDICSPLLYDPEKYAEMKIIKPDYEIMENCSTKTERILIIFDSMDRSKCYEYYWSTTYKKFLCSGCSAKRKYMAAEICHENSDNEYIRLLNDEHVCEIRKYNPAKFNQTNKFVTSPNFEVHKNIKNGKERKTLIIFDESDRTLCYTYFFATHMNLFYCGGCRRKGKNVSAKICQNSDREDYVILSNAEHVCSLQSCISETILRPPKFKLVEANEIYTSKIYIFDSSNPKKCYTFTHAENDSNRYYCLGCASESQNSRRKKNQSNAVVYVYFHKDDNEDTDEYYIKMKANQRHVCKLQKYDLEKYERKILKPKDDYFLFRHNEKEYIYLAIYCSDDKKFRYQLCYNKSGKDFYCLKCAKKKINIGAKLRQDSNGNEFIAMKEKKHVCKPIKVSSLINSESIVLEKSGLSLEEKPKPKKEKEIEESRIVRSPNFELQRNKMGVPERKLIVFKDSDDKKECYIYGYSQCHYNFVCKNCKAMAKVVEENGEKYVILGQNVQCTFM